jgi:hypothetical protein
MRFRSRTSNEVEGMVVSPAASRHDGDSIMGNNNQNDRQGGSTKQGSGSDQQLGSGQGGSSRQASGNLNPQDNSSLKAGSKDDSSARQQGSNTRQDRGSSDR